MNEEDNVVDGSGDHEGSSIAKRQAEAVAGEYRRVAQEIGRKDYESRVAQLTLNELSSLPSTNIRVYKSLGRAYALTSLEQVKNRLHAVHLSAQTEGGKLREQRAQLEHALQMESRVPSSVAQ
jgi:hypothetical protein